MSRMLYVQLRNRGNWSFDLRWYPCCRMRWSDLLVTAHTRCLVQLVTYRTRCANYVNQKKNDPKLLQRLRRTYSRLFQKENGSLSDICLRPDTRIGCKVHVALSQSSVKRYFTMCLVHWMLKSHCRWKPFIFWGSQCINQAIRVN